MANRQTRAAAQSRCVRRLLDSGRLSLSDLDAVRCTLTGKGRESLQDADQEQAEILQDKQAQEQAGERPEPGNALFHSRPVQPYPAQKQQLLDDAAEVAASIYDMLGIRQTCQFNDIWRLCEEHGCRPLISSAIGVHRTGLFIDYHHDITDASDGGIIVLSDNMTFAESCAVMVHELAHRVLYSGRITDWALEHNHCRYDPHDWQEAVARAVERLYLEAGGTGLFPARF